MYVHTQDEEDDDEEVMYHGAHALTPDVLHCICHLQGLQPLSAHCLLFVEGVLDFHKPFGRLQKPPSGLGSLVHLALGDTAGRRTRSKLPKPQTHVIYQKKGGLTWRDMG